MRSFLIFLSFLSISFSIKAQESGSSRIMITESKSWRTTYNTKGVALSKPSQQNKAWLIDDKAVIDSFSNMYFNNPKKEWGYDGPYPVCGKHWEIFFLKNNEISSSFTIDTFCYNFDPEEVVLFSKCISKAPSFYLYELQIPSNQNHKESIEQLKANKYDLLLNKNNRDLMPYIKITDMVYFQDNKQHAYWDKERKRVEFISDEEIRDTLEYANEKIVESIIEKLKKNYSIEYYKNSGGSSRGGMEKENSENYLVYFKNGTDLKNIEKDVYLLGGEMKEKFNPSSYYMLIISDNPSLEKIKTEMMQKFPFIKNVTKY